MRKSKMWRMLTVAAVAASMTCGIAGVQSVSADDKKTLKVAMECGYAPYNWTQPDDSNGAVQISGSSDYAYGYDVMMAKKIADELGYDLEIVKLDWDSLVPAVQSGQVRLTVLLQDSLLQKNVSRWLISQIHIIMHPSSLWLRMMEITRTQQA